MKIKQKLQSRAGASLLIAMVFMLVCTFVGGSVLAAATANSKHLKTMTGDQQDMLSQRSALTLLVDDLKIPRGMIRMTIKKNDVVEHPYTIGEGGVKVPTGATSSSNNVNFIFSNRDYTTMQRLMLECAVLSYVEKYDVDPATVTLENFVSGGELIDTMGKFWLTKNEKRTVYITDPISGAQTEFSVSCASAGADDAYSFYVGFADENRSQTRLTCHAKVTERGTYTEVREDDRNMTDADVTTYTTFIDWEAPKITKGA